MKRCSQTFFSRIVQCLHLMSATPICVGQKPALALLLPDTPILSVLQNGRLPIRSRFLFLNRRSSLASVLLSTCRTYCVQIADSRAYEQLVANTINWNELKNKVPDTAAFSSRSSFELPSAAVSFFDLPENMPEMAPAMLRLTPAYPPVNQFRRFPCLEDTSNPQVGMSWVHLTFALAEALCSLLSITACPDPGCATC